MIILVSILYVVYVGLSLRPQDIQVVTHYSAFGVTHFYRTKWYYLIGFALFGILIMVTHLAVLIKLTSQNMRSLAIGYAWFTVALVAIAAVMTHSILTLAFLQ
jgi:hypothetical protein